MDAPTGSSTAVFDPMGYGEATDDPVTRGGQPDVSFEVLAENRLGWYDGAFGARVALNRRLYPDGEMLMVRQGQLAQVTVINRSFATHPMHLHGHFFSVLSRNGQPRSGCPLRLDSIDVRPGRIGGPGVPRRQSWSVDVPLPQWLPCSGKNGSDGGHQGASRCDDP